MKKIVALPELSNEIVVAFFSYQNEVLIAIKSVKS